MRAGGNDRRPKGGAGGGKVVILLKTMRAQRKGAWVITVRKSIDSEKEEPPSKGISILLDRTTHKTPEGAQTL